MNSEREREREKGRKERADTTFPASRKERGELTSGVVERGPENDACGSGTVDKE